MWFDALQYVKFVTSAALSAQQAAGQAAAAGSAAAAAPPFAFASIAALNAPVRAATSLGLAGFLAAHLVLPALNKYLMRPRTRRERSDGGALAMV